MNCQVCNAPLGKARCGPTKRSTIVYHGLCGRACAKVQRQELPDEETAATTVSSFEKLRMLWLGPQEELYHSLAGSIASRRALKYAPNRVVGVYSSLVDYRQILADIAVAIREKRESEQ